MNKEKINYSLHYENWHDKTSHHAEKMANNLMPMLNTHIPTDLGAKVLDIGCGYGFALKAMQKFGFQDIMGLEISQEQADVALSFGFNVLVVKDTIGFLENTHLKFDFIILFDVLEHVIIEDQIKLLRSIFKVLNPNGKIILTTPNANAILSARWRYIDFTHYSSFTEHSLSFVLKNAGFENIWIDNKKGIGKFPKNIFKSGYKKKLRKWIIRVFWRQVFLAELPWEDHNKISYELNLTAVAQK